MTSGRAAQTLAALVAAVCLAGAAAFGHYPSSHHGGGSHGPTQSSYYYPTQGSQGPTYPSGMGPAASPPQGSNYYPTQGSQGPAYPSNWGPSSQGGPYPSDPNSYSPGGPTNSYSPGGNDPSRYGPQGSPYHGSPQQGSPHHWSPQHGSPQQSSPHHWSPHHGSHTPNMNYPSGAGYPNQGSPPSPQGGPASPPDNLGPPCADTAECHRVFFDTFFDRHQIQNMIPDVGAWLAQNLTCNTQWGRCQINDPDFIPQCGTFRRDYVGNCSSGTCAQFFGCGNGARKSIANMPCDLVYNFPRCAVCEMLDSRCLSKDSLKASLGLRNSGPIRSVQRFVVDSLDTDKIEDIPWRNASLLDRDLFSSGNLEQLMSHVLDRFGDDRHGLKHDAEQFKKRIFIARSDRADADSDVPEFGEVAVQMSASERAQLFHFMSYHDMETVTDEFITQKMTPEEAPNLPNGTFYAWARQDRVKEVSIAAIRNASASMRREVRFDKLADVAQASPDKAIALVCGEYAHVCPLRNGNGVVMDLEIPADLVNDVMGNLTNRLSHYYYSGELYVHPLDDIETDSSADRLRRLTTSDASVRVVASANAADDAVSTVDDMSGGVSGTDAAVYIASSGGGGTGGGGGGSSGGTCQEGACCGAGTQYDQSVGQCVATYEGALGACHAARGQWGWTCAMVGDSCGQQPSGGQGGPYMSPSAGPNSSI